MKIELDHFGIAVNDPAALEKTLKALGLKKGEAEAVPSQGVETHFFPMPSAEASAELLVPTDPNGAVAKFLSKRGSGVHHLAFRVEKGRLDELCKNLQEQGFKLVYSEPQPAAHGMRMNFIHPKSTGGILIEVMEPGE